jgi:hypothetical protein
MKKILMMAALAAFIAAPVMANEKSPEEMQKKVDEWFAKTDTDANGTVSKAEFTVDAQKMFDEADTDDNDQLSKDEKLAWKKAKHDKKD